MQTFKYLIIQSRFLHHFIHHFCVVLHHFTISYDTLTKSTIHTTRLRILYLQGFLTFCKFKNKELDKFLLILLHFILKPPIFKTFRLYLFLLKHSAAHLLHIFSQIPAYTHFSIRLIASNSISSVTWQCGECPNQYPAFLLFFFRNHRIYLLCGIFLHKPLLSNPYSFSLPNRLTNLPWYIPSFLCVIPCVIPLPDSFPIRDLPICSPSCIQYIEKDSKYPFHTTIKLLIIQSILPINPIKHSHYITVQPEMLCLDGRADGKILRDDGSGIACPGFPCTYFGWEFLSRMWKAVTGYGRPLSASMPNRAKPDFHVQPFILWTVFP